MSSHCIDDAARTKRIVSIQVYQHRIHFIRQFLFVQVRRLNFVRICTYADRLPRTAYINHRKLFHQVSFLFNLRSEDSSHLSDAIPRPYGKRVDKTKIIAFVLLVSEPALRTKGLDVFPCWCVVSCCISVDADSNLSTLVSKQHVFGLEREHIHLPECGHRDRVVRQDL